jgi:TorA maturation chaperone TorD
VTASNMKESDSNQAETRKMIYAFLANIFLQEPSPDRIQEQIRSLQSILEESGEDHNAVGCESLESLRQEFFDCFFVPTSGRYVPPYESAVREYNSGNPGRFGKLNGPAARHVEKCWENTGFNSRMLKIFEPLHEVSLPDHVGIELAFMSFLCGAEEGARGPNGKNRVNRWRDFQKNFAREHLNKFLPQFALALQAASPGFYATAARVAAFWVAEDLEELENEAEGGKTPDDF